MNSLIMKISLFGGNPIDDFRGIGLALLGFMVNIHGLWLICLIHPYMASFDYMTTKSFIQLRVFFAPHAGACKLASNQFFYGLHVDLAKFFGE